MLGLLVGKPVGIFLLGWVLVKSRLGNLPEGVSWTLIGGAGMLGGIGFTMSIFIANLAYTDVAMIQASKIAVLAGSLFSTLAGLGFLFVATRQRSVLQAE